jgi:hypothetical protein
MEFLKKNYEKVLLGVMLAGVLGVLVFMLFYIQSEQQSLEVQVNNVINPTVKPLTNLDLTLQTSTVERLNSAYKLDLDSSNKLFNPMIWQLAPGGRKIKISTGNEVGLGAVVITSIDPLYFNVTLDTVTTNEAGVRYTIGVEKQAATVASKRKKQSRYASVGEKANDYFALLEAKGDPENPESLVLKLVDTGEVVEITKQKPYQRVEGYTADFRYDPEKKVFRGRRVGDRMTFYNTDYTVADINQGELVLLDQSNQKKNTLQFNR